MNIESLRLQSDRRMVTAVMLVLLVPAVWFVRTDLALYAKDPSQLTLRFIVRSLLVITMITGIVLMRGVRSRLSYRRIVFAVSIALGVFLVIINGMRPKGATLPLRTPMLVMAAMYGGLPNTFWRQVFPPTLVTIGLAILRITWVTSTADGDWQGDVLILAALNLIGILVIQRRLALEADVSTAWHSEHDARIISEKALADLKTLRGIIPICSHCKNVRTDVGEWEKVEWYVAEHSDAEFSHSVCPDCETRYYAELK